MCKSSIRPGGSALCQLIYEAKKRKEIREFVDNTGKRIHAVIKYSYRSAVPEGELMIYYERRQHSTHETESSKRKDFRGTPILYTLPFQTIKTTTLHAEQSLQVDAMVLLSLEMLANAPLGWGSLPKMRLAATCVAESDPGVENKRPHRMFNSYGGDPQARELDEHDPQNRPGVRRTRGGLCGGLVL
jgi:hypothetical protein